MTTKIDPETEYLMLDMGGDRLTHYPTGNTCLRHPWMIGRGASAWMEKLAEFTAAHPRCTTVVNSRLQIIGDLADAPVNKASFEVGDTLVRIDVYDASGLGVSKVVEITADDQRALEADDAPESYLLDDGRVMYWDSRANGWMATGPDGQSQRHRRPLEGEDLSDLHPEPDILASAWLPMFAKRLDSICARPDFIEIVGDEREIADLQDMARQVISGVSASDGQSPTCIPEAIELLDLVVSIGETTMSKPGAADAFEIGRAYDGMASILRTAKVVQTTVHQILTVDPAPPVPVQQSRNRAPFPS